MATDKDVNSQLDEILKKLEEAEKEYARKLQDADLDRIIQEADKHQAR
ncbi:MAG: hypothetical protein IIZ27_00870 [Solobacterium sp.]|nr:hypothetical protein [Solobacterium sp.]MBR2668184.1 hypothetical protein [Solobacterium sp.]